MKRRREKEFESSDGGSSDGTTSAVVPCCARFSSVSPSNRLFVDVSIDGLPRQSLPAEAGG